MCCIFTYISWTIDLIQRVWSFLMSCCIGGAVCVLFFMAVASGVAFGYHYSISEFLIYNDSKLTISLTRNIDSPVDADSWWSDDPREINRRSGGKQFHRSNTETEEDFGVVTTTEVGTTTQSTYKTIMHKNVISAVTTKDIGLEDIIKKYPPGSVNQMKAALNHIYMNKVHKPTRTTTKKRKTVSHPLMSTRIKTFKPFEYISDYDDIMLTARTFTPIALFSEYDETEIENWRRVAQSMQYDYPIEVHENVPRIRDEAYPIYDRAIRKEYTAPRKNLKSAFNLIEPSYPVTRTKTLHSAVDETTTKSDSTTKTIKPIKLIRYTTLKSLSSTEMKLNIYKYTTKANQSKESISLKEVNVNKTQHKDK